MARSKPRAVAPKVCLIFNVSRTYCGRVWRSADRDLAGAGADATVVGVKCPPHEMWKHSPRASCPECLEEREAELKARLEAAWKRGGAT